MNSVIRASVSISSACLIAAFDTCIDHSLNRALGGISTSPWTALPSPSLPSPLLVDVDVTCRDDCLKKYVFLITCPPGEEEQGAHLCLCVLLGKTVLDVEPLLSQEPLTKKNRPCIWYLRTAQALMLDCRFQLWEGS